MAKETMASEQLLTAEELAERWHTTKGGILNLRYRGRAPAGMRLGRQIHFRLCDVIEYENSRLTNTGGSDAA